MVGYVDNYSRFGNYEAFALLLYLIKTKKEKKGTCSNDAYLPCVYILDLVFDSIIIILKKYLRSFNPVIFKLSWLD